MKKREWMGVIMHKTQVESNETNTHQVTICLPQRWIVPRPQTTSLAN